MVKIRSTLQRSRGGTTTRLSICAMFSFWYEIALGHLSICLSWGPVLCSASPFQHSTCCNARLQDKAKMSFLSPLQPPSTNVECLTALGTTVLCLTRKCFNLEPGFSVCRWTTISSHQGATSSSPKVDLLLRFSQISQDGAIIHIQAIFVCSHYQAHTPQANLCDQTDGVIYTRTKQA